VPHRFGSGRGMARRAWIGKWDRGLCERAWRRRRAGIENGAEEQTTALHGPHRDALPRSAAAQCERQSGSPETAGAVGKGPTVSATAQAAPERMDSRPTRSLANFRLIPRVETYPAVVAFAKTDAGKVGMLVLFGLGLAYTGTDWWPLLLWLTL